jgi:hypothetical protein
MNFLNRYKVLIAVILPVLILVLIKSSGAYHFKSDAKKWAEPTFKRSNIILADHVNSLSGEKLIINLGQGDYGNYKISAKVINLPADSILNRDNLNIIRNHNGPVILFSSETSVAARIWMIISQMGYRNIYILTNDTDNERLKYKFRPDTLVRPEL